MRKCITARYDRQPIHEPYYTMTYFFAVLESLEQEGNDSDVYLDCIAVETYDGMVRAGTLSAYCRSEPIPYVGNVLRVKRSDIPASVIEAAERASGRLWLKLVVAQDEELPDLATIPAEFVSLSANDNEIPRNLRISVPEDAGPAVQRQAENFFRVSSDRPTGFEALAKELESSLVRRQKHVVAYRIGQGNCNAIVDVAEHPIIFFDLGWPIQLNVRGAPIPAPDLLSVPRARSRAPVILSHWDWDHWAFALESWSYDSSAKGARPKWKKDALERPWLAPRPAKRLKLGPSHYRLIEELFRRRARGRRSLHFFPAKAQARSMGDLVVLKCSPPTGQALTRNNSGLAVAVRVYDGHESGWVLLPGDADFRSIPLEQVRELGPESLVGMVASHHGGKIDVFSIPQTRVPGARLVVSTGTNGYGHPNDQVLANYEFLGWTDQVRTDVASSCGGLCGLAHVVGAFLVQPDHFTKPQCECYAIPKARMSIHH
ncbi:hypothetical protein [Paraburkholderia youngii]|uniref:hypothetical protein n=1 Tax=Paraburkholderia youngii TaxID=2782701 RepID=UPI003D199F0B